MIAGRYLGKLGGILCLTACTITSGQAQQVIDQPIGIKASFYDEKTDRVVRIFPDRYEVVNPTDWAKSVKRLDGLKRNTSAGDFYLINDRLWMVLQPDNLVSWESGDSLVTMGGVLRKKMYINAFHIRHGDDILSHGGYGLWSARQLLLRFDTTSQSWKPWPVKNNTDIPPGLLQHNGYIQNNRLWLFAGVTMSDRDPLAFPDNKEVWSFGFADSVWRMDGLLNPKLFHSKYTIPHKVETMDYRNKLIIYPVEDKMAVLDFVGNLVRFYRLPSYYKKTDYASQTNGFFRQGKFYIYHFNKRLNDTINIPAPDFREIPEKLFLGDLITEEPIYGSATSWWLRDLWRSKLTRGVGIGIALIAGMAIFLRRHTKTKASVKPVFRLKGNSLFYHGKLILNGNSECGILRKFTEGASEISLGDLLDGFDDIKESARSTVNRINLEIRSEANIDFDLIEYIRLTNDQRMSGFRLTGKAELKIE